MLVALLLAGVASFYASGDPDGLTKVSEDQGFAQTEQEHQTGDGPFAGYETKGVADGRLSGGMAGVVGSLVVLRSPAAWCSSSAGVVPPTRGLTDGLPARPQAALPRALVAAPAPGARQARRAGRVHADRGRHAPGVVPGLRRLPRSCCSRWSPSRRCRRRTSPSGWSSRCRSWSSRSLLPFVATGPQIEVLGLSVSASTGLLGAWGLLVKGTLGVLASLLLAATTEPRALLAGLERLRDAALSWCRSWAS